VRYEKEKKIKPEVDVAAVGRRRAIYV